MYLKPLISYFLLFIDSFSSSLFPVPQPPVYQSPQLSAVPHSLFTQLPVHYLYPVQVYQLYSPVLTVTNLLLSHAAHQFSSSLSQFPVCPQFTVHFSSHQFPVLCFLVPFPSPRTLPTHSLSRFTSTFRSSPKHNYKSVPCLPVLPSSPTVLSSLDTSYTQK